MRQSGRQILMNIKQDLLILVYLHKHDVGTCQLIYCHYVLRSSSSHGGSIIFIFKSLVRYGYGMATLINWCPKNAKVVATRKWYGRFRPKKLAGRILSHLARKFNNPAQIARIIKDTRHNCPQKSKRTYFVKQGRAAN